MNNAQTIFTIFYGVYFAVTTTLTGKFSPFDTPSMYKGCRAAWKRFALSFLLLNVVPLVYFLKIYRWLSLAPEPFQPTFWSMLALLLLSIAGFGFYRIYFGIMLLKKDGRYSFYNGDLPKALQEDLDNRPSCHSEARPHIIPGILWVAVGVLLAHLFLPI